MSSELEYFAEVADVPPGERVIKEIRGREIAVFNMDGEYHALANYCIHQAGPLCEGNTPYRLEADETGGLSVDKSGRNVACPWHGWEFDIKSGHNLARPDDYRVPTYDIVVEDDELYVVL